MIIVNAPCHYLRKYVVLVYKNNTENIMYYHDNNLLIDFLEVATTFHDSQIIINMYVSSVQERRKQGHEDSTSDIYWDSWGTSKTREKSTNLSISLIGKYSPLPSYFMKSL